MLRIIIKPFLALMLSIFISVDAHAVVPSKAYIVDADYTVRLVSSDGKTNQTKSASNFALKISVGGDGSVWVVSTDQGVVDRGGNLLKVLPKGSTQWKTIKISSGAEAVNVSGDASGGAWVIDGDTHEILQIDQSGKVLSVSPISPFFEISAAFSGGSNGQIWAIGSKPNQNIGNPVYYMLQKDQKWKSRGVGAQALSGYWTINSNGAVITAASDSSTHTLGPNGTASSISVGKSGAIWVISQEANIKQGGAYLKYWNEQGSKASNWVKVPTIGARSVSVL